MKTPFKAEFQRPDFQQTWNSKDEVMCRVSYWQSYLFPDTSWEDILGSINSSIGDTNREIEYHKDEIKRLEGIKKDLLKDRELAKKNI